MKRLRELVICNAGLWYRSHVSRCDRSCNVRLKSISPRSYRAGVEVGYVTGSVSTFVLCVMLASLLVGSGVVGFGQ